MRLVPTSTPAAQPPLILRLSVTDQVHCELRRRILHGVIEGGEPIPESQCAETLGVSRVPVREALLMLEREGLLQRDRRGRTVARTLGGRDYEEILTLRLEVEGMAARLCADARTEQDLEALESNITAFAAAKSAEELASLDAEFHGILCSASGHRWLLTAWSTIRWPFEALLVKNFRSYIQATSLEESKVSTEDHRRIVEAIRSRKPHESELLVRQHISRWTDWKPA